MGAPTSKKAQCSGRTVQARLVDGQHAAEILQVKGLLEVARAAKHARWPIVTGPQQLMNTEAFARQFLKSAGPCVAEGARGKLPGFGRKGNPAAHSNAWPLPAGQGFAARGLKKALGKIPAPFAMLKRFRHASTVPIP